MVHLVPLLLGDRIRLFDELDGSPVRLQQVRFLEGRGVVHLRYEVVDRLPR